MDSEPPQQVENGSKSSRLAGATSNTAIIGTQEECRHQLAHHDAPNAATKHMTQDAHFNIVHMTASSKNMKQHAVGCDYIHIAVNSDWPTAYRTAAVCREVRELLIAACNGKPPCSITAFVHTDGEIENHDIVSTGIFTDEYSDEHPRE